VFTYYSWKLHLFLYCLSHTSAVFGVSSSNMSQLLFFHTLSVLIKYLMLSTNLMLTCIVMNLFLLFSLLHMGKVTVVYMYVATNTTKFMLNMLTVVTYCNYAFKCMFWLSYKLCATIWAYLNANKINIWASYKYDACLRRSGRYTIVIWAECFLISLC
jgi:hypothetical protein